jgi:probable rRNA maturation factor
MSIAVQVNQVETNAPQYLVELIHRAVEVTLQHADVNDASVSVTLLNNTRIRNMSRKYLQHDQVTDVISFPLYEQGEQVVGDVYIGYEQAQDQAADAGVDLEEELARLSIHGTLHVLGYDHPEDGDRTRSEMWQLQEAILAKMPRS